MCMCVCMFMYCHVWLPSSLCPASFQHPYSILAFPASFQLPHSILTVSSQHHPSLKHQYVLIHMCSDHQCVLVHVCIGNHSWLICMYIYNIYVCIHHQSSLITCMHWSSICMTGLSHTCTVFLCVSWLPRSHVGAVSGDKNDAYPGCSAENQKKDISNIHKNINKTKNILTTNKKNQQNNNTWNTKQETQIRNTPHGNHTHVLHFQP